MGTEPATTRDQRAIEVQLAGVLGRLHAAGDVDRDRAEELAGQAAALSWVLGRRPEAPVRLAALEPTRASVLEEFAAAGAASLDTESPARAYAAGAYEALRWLTGARAESLIPLPA